MPTNIKSGNSAQFNFRFRTATGATVTPTSGAVTLSYTVGGILVSSSIDLTLSGAFWTATWSSVGVDHKPGVVLWTVASSATTNPALIGELRIIDP